MALLKLLDWYAIFFYRVSIPLFTVTLYLWCGAVIFEALESPGETSAQNTFILNMDCLRNNTSNETYSGLETLVGNPDMYPWADWDFFGSYFFAYTLITTIGYGVFTPQTAGGKIFTSFFALLGIPFFILQVGDLGQAYIEIGFQWYLDWVGAAARRRVGQFDEIDHNHSGSFTKEDFEHRLNESGMWLMVHRVDALCEASDADHSGTIDKEEHDKVLDEVASIVKQRAQFIIAFTITVRASTRSKFAAPRTAQSARPNRVHRRALDSPNSSHIGRMQCLTPHPGSCRPSLCSGTHSFGCPRAGRALMASTARWSRT